MANEQNKPDGSTDDQDDTSDKPDLSQIINQALSTHMKRYEQKANKAWEEKFKTLEEKFSAGQQVVPDPKKKDNENPELAALRSQLESVKSEMQKAQERASDLEKKRKEDGVYQEVRNILNKHVRPETLDVLSSYIFKASGKVEYDEDGSPLFKVRKSIAPGLAEEEILMPLQDGIEAYLKTKEAAPYLPAPAPSGNAPKSPITKRTNTPGGPPKWDTPATSDRERVQRAQQIEEWIQNHKT